MKSQEWQQSDVFSNVDDRSLTMMLRCKHYFMPLVEADTSFYLDSSKQATNESNDKEFLKF
jgi:hypothetical protein